MKLTNLILASAVAFIFSSQAIASVEDFNGLIAEAQKVQFDTHQDLLESANAPAEAFEFETKWRDPEQIDLESPVMADLLLKGNMNLAQAK